jgi:hypothetical protein
MTSRDARRVAVQGYLGLVRFRFTSLLWGLLIMALLPWLLLFLRGH